MKKKKTDFALLIAMVSFGLICIFKGAEGLGITIPWYMSLSYIILGSIIGILGFYIYLKS